MAENQDYKEMLQVLNEHQVEYLIVGGYAVMKYTEPRYTKDMDVWVAASEENSKRLFEALMEFGAPLQHYGITPRTFMQEGVFFQLGVPPARIDFLTTLEGVRFSDAWQKRVQSRVLDVSVNFISVQDLIAKKQTVGRSIDLEDLKQLLKKASCQQS